MRDWARASEAYVSVPLRRQRGFTLLEVVLVLSLLVLIAALSVPVFQTALVGQRIRKAADQIHGGMVEGTRDRAENGKHASLLLRCRIEPVSGRTVCSEHR